MVFVVLITDVSVTLEPLISVSMIATAEPSISVVSIGSSADDSTDLLLQEVLQPANETIMITMIRMIAIVYFFRITSTCYSLKKRHLFIDQ